MNILIMEVFPTPDPPTTISLTGLISYVWLSVMYTFFGCYYNGIHIARIEKMQRSIHEFPNNYKTDSL
jgi:hypothetical protein